MNNKLISLLVIMCLTSVLIIGVEWSVSIWMQKNTLDSLSVMESKATQDEIPQIDLKKKTEESYADLVSRPLFIKGRRQIEEPSPEEVENALSVPVVFEWKLSGIFSTKDGLSAFLSRLNVKNTKEKYRKVSKDEVLDGWRLTEIYEDKVLFVQGDQQKELFLRKVKNKSLSNNSLSNNSNTLNTSRNIRTNTRTPEAIMPENNNE